MWSDLRKKRSGGRTWGRSEVRMWSSSIDLFVLLESTGSRVWLAMGAGGRRWRWLAADVVVGDGGGRPGRGERPWRRWVPRSSKSTQYGGVCIGICLFQLSFNTKELDLHCQISIPRTSKQQHWGNQVPIPMSRLQTQPSDFINLKMHAHKGQVCMCHVS
jgi:hypothetical protein